MPKHVPPLRGGGPHNTATAVGLPPCNAGGPTPAAQVPITRPFASACARAGENGVDTWPYRSYNATALGKGGMCLVLLQMGLSCYYPWLSYWRCPVVGPTAPTCSDFAPGCRILPRCATELITYVLIRQSETISDAALRTELSSDAARSKFSRQRAHNAVPVQVRGRGCILELLAG